MLPEPMLPEFKARQEEARTAAGVTGSEEQCWESPGAITLVSYQSVHFEEYHSIAKNSISELTSVLDFHLANCASLFVNRSVMDTLSKRSTPFTASLGPALDPCATLLAEKLKIRRRIGYDDGSGSSLLWGVLLGQGHLTSHVAAYGTALGGGAMPVSERVRNVIQYYRLQLWHRRVYEPRISSFRHRYRVDQYGEAPVACHLKGQVIITGADWGLIEPQPLPPSIKLVGPLRAGRGGAEPLPPEVEEHVAGAPHGVAVIAFPPDYRPPLRALLAIAEAVLDLKQRIVWQLPAADIARVRQVYLPLKHARNVLMLPEVPLEPLMAHRNVVSLISAGSIQTIYTAIYHAKPIMGVPLTTAQGDLAARLGALGAGQRLSRTELEGGAASYRVSVAIERMSNVYSFTQSMQQLSTQLRAMLGSQSALERAAAWVETTTRLDEQGRQYLTPRSASVGASTVTGGGGGALAAGGGGGCMGPMEAANAAAYAVIILTGLAAVGLVWSVVHICTRMPPPPKPRAKLIISHKNKDD
ncbi:hypothetical protein HYH03_018405 [Edaphochlamys debaryana]|uniref:Uncharacterized protein n=1 Tax=Edaphochlamys debaryana TaxID=47281 RepID=A0A836BNB3_9CHLO|nr:hypothetical protein HYH03_018405 [Edaphochlamys debaryana]|eukprot:KAG2482667.1 hypothetical protein HYH03_018405 [Edaphochlamys debaryana]